MSERQLKIERLSVAGFDVYSSATGLHTGFVGFESSGLAQCHQPEWKIQIIIPPSFLSYHPYDQLPFSELHHLGKERDHRRRASKERASEERASYHSPVYLTGLFSQSLSTASFDLPWSLWPHPAFLLTSQSAFAEQSNKLKKNILVVGHVLVLYLNLGKMTERLHSRLPHRSFERFISAKLSAITFDYTARSNS